MEQDSLLLRRYAEHRDQAAFAELVRRHVDAVYSAALRRLNGDTHLAEDVTQRVFAELARQSARVCDHPALTAWLYTTTRNQAANTVRAEQRRKALEQEAFTMSELNANEPSNADWDQIAPALDWAMDQLNEKDRVVVLLRYIDRKSFGSIAELLGVSEDAARMRVDRAVEKLRGMLARRGIVSSAAFLSAGLAQQCLTAAPPALAASATAAATAVAPISLGP